MTPSELYSFIKFMLATVFFVTLLPAVYLLFVVNETYVPRVLQRRVFHVVERIFLCLCTETFYILNKREFHVCVDRSLADARRIFIASNHLSEFDFIFMLRVLYELNRYENVMFVMKKGIFSIPIFGEMCRLCGFVGVDRASPTALTDFENDAVRLRNMNRFTLIIFPEGTIWTTPIYTRNCKYAASKNIEPNSWCLIPKRGGAHVLAGIAAETGVAYVNSTLFFNPWSIDISPMKVKFDYMMYYSDRISINFVMQDDTHRVLEDDFLLKSFRRKDALLQHVEKTGSFSSRDEFIDLLSKSGTYDKDRQMVLSMTLGTKLGHSMVLLCIYFYYRLLRG